MSRFQQSLHHTSHSSYVCETEAPGGGGGGTPGLTVSEGGGAAATPVSPHPLGHELTLPNPGRVSERPHPLGPISS